MIIERAQIKDMEGINKLLKQVLMVHHNGRPDLFKADVKKYTDEELAAIIEDDSRPIFVARDEQGVVIGYAFCGSFCTHKESLDVLSSLVKINSENFRKCADCIISLRFF